MNDRRLVLATANRGKLRELAPPFAALGYRLMSQAELGIVSAEEGAPTFVENALLKARQASRLSGLPAVADDSGLCVPALGGAPGLFSARYARPGASDAENIDKLLRTMAGLEGDGRRAYFYCCIAWLQVPEDPVPVIGEGFWFGRILEAPRGAGGFGYDPVFHCPELGRSAAELDPAEKQRHSHRGQALAALLARYTAQFAQPASASA